MNKHEFFEELLDTFEKYIEAKDDKTKREYKEIILEFIYENDINLHHDLNEE